MNYCNYNNYQPPHNSFDSSIFKTSKITYVSIRLCYWLYDFADLCTTAQTARIAIGNSLVTNRKP